MNSEQFTFYPADDLRGREIVLTLQKTTPANPTKGYVPAYYFDIRLAASGVRIGHLHLRIGFSENLRYGGHIGFGVDAPYRGNAYAQKATELALPLAKKHGMKSLLITCNPDNTASRKTIENLGAEFIEQMDIPHTDELYARGERTKLVYKLAL